MELMTGKEVAECSETIRRRLVEGPITELVEFYCLGKRVSEALAELGCKVGTDILTLDINQIYSIYGQTTSARINLLQDYVKERKVKSISTGSS